MERSLILPPPKLEPHWALTQRHTTFLDMTIILPYQHCELYKMVFISAETPVRLQKLASAVVSSADGREYLQSRTAQLTAHFFGETPMIMRFGTHPDIVDGQKTDQQIPEHVPEKTVDEILAGMIPKAVKDLQDILKNKNDPNYNDAFRVVLQKIVKDISTEKGARPPVRYLPETCAQCAYNQWINANCEILCHKCKYKKFGDSKGVSFDLKNMMLDNLEDKS